MSATKSWTRLRSLGVVVRALSSIGALPVDLKQNLTGALVTVLCDEDFNDEAWRTAAGLLVELGGPEVTSTLESFLRSSPSFR